MAGGAPTVRALVPGSRQGAREGLSAIGVTTRIGVLLRGTGGPVRIDGYRSRGGNGTVRGPAVRDPVAEVSSTPAAWAFVEPA